MKKLQYTILLALTLLISSCSTINPQTGEREFDPIKTAKVVEVVKQSIASGVLIGVQREPKALPGIQLIRAATCDLASRDVINSQTVNDALLALDLSVLETEDAKLATFLTVNTILGLYNAALADKVRADVSANVYASNILTAVCDGIDQGLAQLGAL